MLLVLFVVAVASMKRGRRSVEVRLDGLMSLFFDVLWREKRIAVYDDPEGLVEDLRRLSDLGLLDVGGDKVVISDVGEFVKRVGVVVPGSSLHRWFGGLFDTEQYQDVVMLEIYIATVAKLGDLMVCN